MPEKIKAACIQICSGPDINDNLKAADTLIREAAAKGAQLIATPENTDQIRRYAKGRFETSGDMETHVAISHFSKLAEELGIYLLIGSIGVKAETQKLLNRSILFSPKGQIIQTYDKIHMFDVTLSRSEFYKESNDIEAGEAAVIAEIDDVKLGMGICYDLRFPHLWRDLAKNGAQILSAPAAFTVPTGKAHWEVLLRARAIETGCFVIAPAQTGEHEGSRKTFGHSMIISPWGEILAEMGSEIGIIVADLDLNEVDKAHSAIPALTHDRDYQIKT
ncbi:MAG: carbon-nitrogen hydrolase family protein [Pseudomonadota bacterium]